MSETPSIAILASGRGTTAESFIHAVQAGIVAAEVSLVIASRPDAEVFARINRLNQQYKLGIEALHISAVTHPGGAGERGEQTLSESEAILAEIKERDISLVALMGYMKKVRGPLLQEYGSLPDHESIFDSRMLNTHPGPLPLTRGLTGHSAQAKVLESGLEASAQTLHAVTADYDAGAIYASHSVPVIAGDTKESLLAGVQATEKAWLPLDINYFLADQREYRSGGFPPPRRS